MANGPRNREKNVTGSGKGVHKRGSGLGTGPVGSGSGFGGSGSGGSNGGSGGGRGNGGGPRRSGGGGGKIGLIVAILVLLLGGGGGSLSALLGGGSGSSSDSGTGTGGSALTGGTALSTGTEIISALLGSGFGSSAYASVGGGSSDWVMNANTGSLNREVAPEARDKFTKIKGNGKDTVTLMVYMCGTDLESKYGMATNDLTEMAKATLSDQVNIIVYTGGCRQWKTGSISNTRNQIYQVKEGGISLLERDMGDKAMTDPATLTEFIRYCDKKYPADRKMLIFWDHGGGSLSGYGYDEKHASAGSMSLAGIDTALKNAGVTFDFIGFDACLMATVETGLMAAGYADYLIASEETEPGVGWYYTDWLSALSKDTSRDTLDIGKDIIDGFVEECARSCRGQKTTLSLIDLSELSQTLGDDFKAFSQSTTRLITDQKYAVVSDARSSSREFAQSSRIDQIDLVNFAKNLGTTEGEALTRTLLSAVKYNRTSSNMTNAYGLSVYFPSGRSSKVQTAVSTYDQIGLDEEYSDCIREFANIQSAGQMLGGSNVSPFAILTGGGSASTSGTQSLDNILGLLEAFSGVSTGGRALNNQQTAEYVHANQFDAGQLYWRQAEDGRYYIPLTEEQWKLLHGIRLNMYYDDGAGYIDLGLDNLFTIDDNGYMYADTDGTWLSINNQPVAYYHMDTVEQGEKYTITGYVPAMLNGDRVKLILIFDDENPKGYVAGADMDYDPSVTETAARGLAEIKTGDTLDFLCDYYSYDGTYQESYYLGDPMTVTEEGLLISDTYVGSDYIGLYKFTDIYENDYWSDQLSK